MSEDAPLLLPRATYANWPDVSYDVAAIVAAAARELN